MKMYSKIIEELLKTQQQDFIEQILPTPEPVTTVEGNSYKSDVIILVVRIVVLGSLYKLWLKYGKK